MFPVNLWLISCSLGEFILITTYLNTLCMSCDGKMQFCLFMQSQQFHKICFSPQRETEAAAVEGK